MKLKDVIKLRSDGRLWFWITAALFLNAWTYPVALDKSNNTPLEELQIDLTNRGPTMVEHAIADTIFFVILWSLVATLLGWLIQLTIVVIRTHFSDFYNRWVT